MNRLLLFILPVLLISCSSSTEETEEAPVDTGPFSDLVWSDEFDDTRLDRTKWITETGAHGWGNNEWQDYTEVANVELNDGILNIIAKKVGNGQRAGDYTSARLNSRFEFTYGRLEVRAKVPTHRGNGLWPAIWMLGDPEMRWPLRGEIDVLEWVSFDPNNVHFTIHSEANNHIDGTQAGSGAVFHPTVDNEFHTYGLLWEEDRLRFYIDDSTNVQFTFDRPENPTQENWPFDKPFYVLLNMAVGGSWGGSRGVNDNIFPATFEIDYVRVYQ
ncbi:MAG: glycoside hydrolase family 16 protein [Bacteroidota bacterium]